MIKKLFLIGLLALTPITLLAQKQALIVAVGQYRDSSIRQLHVGYDINKMQYLLEKRGFKVTILKDSEATYRNVIKQLISYRNLSKNDIFVFYNTSHGVQIDDLNGDENDGKDEAFALYDVTTNNSSVADIKGLLVDDELNFLLSKIPAKKMMITDSCHGGSSYKGLSFGKYTTKSLSCSSNFKNSREAYFRQKHPNNVKNLVVLSASKDNQLSIDTSDNGGLFTDTLYTVWENNPKISFKELTSKVSVIIKKHSYDNIKPQEPQIHTTNNQEDIEINLYLQDVEGYLDMMIRKNQKNHIKLYSKLKTYKVGDNISFKIDTKKRKGHLYILNIDEKKIVKIFPNIYHKSSKIKATNFYFPPKNTNFNIEASISNHKSSQRTVAYAILSNRPIKELESNQKFSFKSLKRIFQNHNNSRISIAKSLFLVVR